MQACELTLLMDVFADCILNEEFWKQDWWQRPPKNPPSTDRVIRRKHQ